MTKYAWRFYYLDDRWYGGAIQAQAISLNFSASTIAGTRFIAMAA